MKSQIFRRIILILLGVTLAGCAVIPKPNPIPSASVIPFDTATRPVSPIATATPGQVVAFPTVTRPVSPLATITVASPLSTPTTVLLPTATLMPSSTPTPSPSPTALIVPVTPTRLPATPASTRAPVVPSSTVISVPAAATRTPALPPPTVVPRPTSTRAPTLTPAPTVAPILVTAWVSDPNPEPGVDVQVYGRLLVNGRPTAGEGMVARWHFKGGSFVDCVADTWVDGVAYCTENTYGLPADFSVRIEVFIRYNQVPYRATTELTIR